MKFSRKLFSGVRKSNVLPFHKAILIKTLADKVPVQVTIATYRNLSLCAQTGGPVYSSKQIDEYEQEVKRLKRWSEEKERTRQTEVYNQERGES